MVSTTENRWEKFWNKQITPLHRYNDSFWYKLYSEEINLILKTSGYNNGSVLEIGCGNGAMFSFLNINKDNYTGVDFSETLLEIFKKKYKGVNLIHADASSFHLDKTFSLIYSNSVIQYFDRKMLHKHILNSIRMLNEKGILFIANIPWRDIKFRYTSGELSHEARYNFVLGIIKGIVKTILKRDVIGYYYNPRDFFKYKKYGVDIVVYGSLYYPYRFHIVLKKSS